MAVVEELESRVAAVETVETVEPNSPGRRRRPLPQRRTRLHRRLGWALGIWFVFEALTGGYLVVGEDLDHWIHGDRYSHGSVDDGPALALQNAEAASGDKARFVTFPRDGDGVYVIELRSNDGETHLAYVDPSGGKINAIEEDGQSAYALILALHSNLNRATVLGIRTSALVGWLGFGWLATLALGYIASRPHRRTVRHAVRVRRGRGRFTFSLDLHKLIGLATIVPVVAIAITGIALQFRPETTTVVDALTPGRLSSEDAETRFKVPISNPIGAGKRATLDVVLQSLRDSGFDTVDSVQVPVGNPVGAFVVYVDIGGYNPYEGVFSPQGDVAVVYLDQYSAEVLAVDSPGDESGGQQIVDDYVGAVHFGTFVSWISRLLWVLTALGITALMVTATLMRTGRWQKRAGRDDPSNDSPDPITQGAH